MQISEKVKPHPVVVNLLTKVEEIIPKWKIVPTKDVIDSAFKDPIKREQVNNIACFYFVHRFFCFGSAKRIGSDIMLVIPMMLVEKQQVDISRQATAENGIGDAQSQHETRRHIT